MSKKYLVKLMPTGKFFFGGDMRFGINGENGEFSSYIIESSKMPQQTSLLGMMRFLLLSNNDDLFDVKNNCIKNGVSVEGMIGKTGFTVKEEKNDYGKILSLGPCCVCKDGKRYFKTPMDKAFSSINWDNVVTATINGKEVQLPELKVIVDGKEDYYSGKYNPDPSFMEYSSSEEIKEDKLFIKDSRIGIDKVYEGKSQTDAFYKQISYRLENGYCFAFDVKVDESVDLTEYNGQLVSLGADASSFIFNAEIIDDIESADKDGLSVVLLSDAYISDEMMKKTQMRYSVNNMRPFRFISTNNSSDASYYRINGKNAAKRSERYELYQAGSVFYFEKEEQTKDFCDILKSREDFNQIGYNKYYIK